MATTGPGVLRSRLFWQTPAALRTSIYRSFSSSSPHKYYSYESEPEPPYPPQESAILTAAFKHVRQSGFTLTSLRNGARDAGYLDASANLFPRGEFELVMWHLQTQRLGLKDKVQFPEDMQGVGRKVRALVLERLRGNVEAGVKERWQEALGLMSLAGNIPPSVRELHLLSDEIWFLAGDTAVDTSWYTKRASLSSIYAATEMFQTTDQSTDGRDTEQFLDRRLEDARVMGGAWRNLTQWAGFQGVAAVNLARNLGARI